MADSVDGVGTGRDVREALTHSTAVLGSLLKDASVQLSPPFRGLLEEMYESNLGVLRRTDVRHPLEAAVADWVEADYGPIGGRQEARLRLHKAWEAFNA